MAKCSGGVTALLLSGEGDGEDVKPGDMVEVTVGRHCLRFETVKVRAEQLIPLSARATAAIRAQQQHVLR